MPLNPPRCPDDILSLFEREETKNDGRRKAIEWLRGVVRAMKPGDRVLIPNPDTGELEDFALGDGLERTH